MIRPAVALVCLLLCTLAPAAALGVDHQGGPDLQSRQLTAQAGVGGFGYRTTSNNLVNITFTNYGSWGLGYTSATTPNFSFPAGAGFEHMVRGGLWIGGRVLCDSGCVDQVAVSFGSEDQNGSVGTPVTEFTPFPNTAATRMIELSSLPNSIVYSPNAISEQDFIAHFRDNPGTQVGSEPHVPLNVEVTESIYSWSFSFAENFVVQHFTIKNVGELLRNVYITHYTEMQSLNKADFALWPSFTSGNAPYGHKVYRFVPTLRMLTEQYCTSVASGCNFDRVPAIAGTMLLGTYPETLGTRYGTGDTAKVLSVRFLTHGYSGSLGIGDTTYGRFTDAQKYGFMQLPTEIADQTTDPNDPSQWITVGPIPAMFSGDSINVDFAFVGGAASDAAGAEAQAELAARHALLAFDLHYKLPTPPPSPRLYARPGDHTVELLWEGSPDTTFDGTGPPGQERDFEGYRIYFGESANGMRLIAQFDRKDTTGFNTGLDSLRMPLDPPVVFTHTVHTPRGDSTAVDTMKYHYVVRGLRDGFKYFGSVTSFDTGNPRVESLESGKTQNRMMVIPGPANGQAVGLGVTVFPNPYRVEARWDANQFPQDHYLWFANLPRHCTLRIYTLAGDLVYSTDFDSAAYRGTNARGVYSQGRDFPVLPPQLSGSMFAWDMISRFNQAVATGLYLYSVEDAATGKRQVGKFAVIKSDLPETQ